MLAVCAPTPGHTTKPASLDPSGRALLRRARWNIPLPLCSSLRVASRLEPGGCATMAPALSFRFGEINRAAVRPPRRQTGQEIGMRDLVDEPRGRLGFSSLTRDPTVPKPHEACRL